MDEARAINKIEINLPQEKIDFINGVYQKELQYWKKIALASKNKNGKKRLTDLVPLRVFLVRKAAVQSGVENVREMLFYLKNQYLPHMEE